MKRFISFFLLMLFSIVIAFPGYSRQVKSSCGFTLKAKASGAVSFAHLLKKCLSTGTNMSEEERSSEEDDDENANECEFLVPAIAVISTPAIKINREHLVHPLPLSEWCEVHCPPPDLLS